MNIELHSKISHLNRQLLRSNVINTKILKYSFVVSYLLFKFTIKKEDCEIMKLEKMTKESLLTEKMKLINDSKIKITHLESELLESKVIEIQTKK
jgi:hypothetical protein